MSKTEIKSKEAKKGEKRQAETKICNTIHSNDRSTVLLFIWLIIKLFSELSCLKKSLNRLSNHLF